MSINGSRRATMGAPFFILLPTFMLAASCGGTKGSGSVPGSSDAPPPPCTPAEAPFAKVMNPATASEFDSCTITVQAKFNSADWGGMVGGDIEGYVKWSAVGPDDPGAGDLGTRMKTMYVAKPKSDAIFTLKQGDPVTIRGTAKTNMVGQVMLFASEITKAQP